ncbi:MAG: hypothetical protein NT156_15425 [Mycobacterium sp.]|nr:hypothetical protein [Mycobacterium sp.]
MKTIGIAAILGTALATAGISLGAGTAAAEQYCGGVNGWGVNVEGSASCPFAFNVARGLSSSFAGQSATVNAYSPVTGLNYSLSCYRLLQLVIQCQGGNAAVVNLVQPNLSGGLAG